MGAKQSSSTETSWADELAAETSPDNTPVPVRPVDRAGNPYRDEDGNPAVILVLGEYSDAVKAHDRRRQAVNLRGNQPTLEPEEIERLGAMRLAAATAGWKFAIGGKAIPFSFQNATALYQKAPWVADDVARAMKAHAGFFGESSRD